MSTCLLTEVKRQWATLVLGWVQSDGFEASASRQKPPFCIVKYALPKYRVTFFGVSFQTPKDRQGGVTNLNCEFMTARDGVNRP